jgi:hypothetical protein
MATEGGSSFEIAPICGVKVSVGFKGSDMVRRQRKIKVESSQVLPKAAKILRMTDMERGQVKRKSGATGTKNIFHVSIFPLDSLRQTDIVYRTNMVL